jgi:hypothetical protein
MLGVLIAVLGFIIGNGIYYGQIQSTFDFVVIDPNHPNTCKNLKLCAMLAIILGILIPGFGGLIPAAIIVDGTYAIDCQQNTAAFSYSLSTSPELRAQWDVILASAQPANQSQYLTEWIDARCSAPHVMNAAFIALFVICFVVGLSIHCARFCGRFYDGSM